MAADPRVDRYILGAPLFARPILARLRDLVHQECPGVTEEIKWSRPVFLLDGKMIFAMAAFSTHCGFSFWHPGMSRIVAADGIDDSESSGSLGRLTNVADLPPRGTLVRYLREARCLAQVPVQRERTKPKPEIPVPEDFRTALDGNEAAEKTFANFAPSHRREYLEWITEAKRPETRAKRIAATLELLAEGKQRHWKYQ